VVNVSYGGIRSLVVAAIVRICSVIAPRGVWGRGKVWHGETRCGLRISFPKHAGHSVTPRVSNPHN
jgi:hypothetical protein